MNLSELGKTIISAAPALGAALAGPAGGGVGIAIKTLASVFGLAPDAPQEQIEAVIRSDPDASLKLLVAEQNFKTEMRRLDTADLVATLADVQDARKKATEETKTTGRRDYNIYVIAYSVLGGYLGMIAFLLYVNIYLGKPIKDESGILFLLMGNLSTFAGMIMGYIYGTTQQSARKTGIIAQADAVKNGK